MAVVKWITPIYKFNKFVVPISEPLTTNKYTVIDLKLLSKIPVTWVASKFALITFLKTTTLFLV